VLVRWVGGGLCATRYFYRRSAAHFSKLTEWPNKCIIEKKMRANLVLKKSVPHQEALCNSRLQIKKQEARSPL
jgi:hypothetical protein